MWVNGSPFGGHLPYRVCCLEMLRNIGNHQETHRTHKPRAAFVPQKHAKSAVFPAAPRRFVSVV